MDKALVRNALKGMIRATDEDSTPIIRRLARIQTRAALESLDAEAASGAGEREDAQDEFATVEDWEHDDQRELSLLYNHRADDSLQFNRGQMREAIRHGKRLASLPPATDPAMVEQRRKPDYEPAWREMYDALSWMHGCKALARYAGWPLGKIATDLIDQAYPGLREGTAPTAEGLVTKMREAICGVADDYQTSEQHHPGHVLIPLAKFEQLRAVAEELEANHD